MDKKTLRFFRFSIVAVVAVCTVVFISLTSFMTRQTKMTVTEISNTYMAEMSRQIKQKFAAIIGLRLQQVEGIMKRTPPDTVTYGRQMKEDLRTSADLRNFSYLGLCTREGIVEELYGGDLKFLDDEETWASLMADGTLVTEAVTSDGDKVLVLGMEAAYPMKNDQVSDILIVRLPME